jgi:NAD-dependent deacetylase
MMKKPIISVLTGAGISAESGISTFRGTDGLWEGHRIEEVASPDGWHKDFKKVLHFYNLRRSNVVQAKPNEAHTCLADLEEFMEVRIITQNVDDLHERGGSTKILHLHGEIRKSRSTAFPSLIYEIEGEKLNEGDLCEMGFQLRPHIVWFGEEVPLIGQAAEWIAESDVIAVIGTSLNVYPAAGLVHAAKPSIPKFIIDPEIPRNVTVPDFFPIPENATTGVAILRSRLLQMYFG